MLMASPKMARITLRGWISWDGDLFLRLDDWMGRYQA